MKDDDVSTKPASSDAPLVVAMRWLARFLSILWAIWTAFWMFMFLVHFLGPFALILSGALFGGAIIASVWRNELLGGTALLVAGMLMLGLTLATFDPHSFGINVVAVCTMSLPPLIAGSLFLTCHRWRATDVD